MCDVGPRDGLQNQPRVLEPELRADLVNRLAAAGLRRIEAVSFVSPKVVPQMAGAAEVLDRIRRRDGVVYAGLALNEKGYERLAAAGGLDEVHFAFAATETFNRRNQNASVEESVQVAHRVAAHARADGIRATVTIGVSFGCPFEGKVDPDYVLAVADRVLDPFDEIVFADTIGVAVPRQVRDVVERAVTRGKPVGVHLHNTRNTGFANAYAAIEAGATVLDASVGGVGGCPFAPKATGNIATEDLVYMLHGEGIETGVELGALLGVSDWLENVLERPLEGQVYRAGTFAPVAE
ncbi:MAG TPA: hydroxymethylglutaryl-CoA lyase [Thermoleophilaceae bacterium]